MTRPDQPVPPDPGRPQKRARVLEMAESEFMVRSEGYLTGVEDLRSVALGVNDSGTPILLQDVASVQRRG